jgi:hypothetical protein
MAHWPVDVLVTDDQIGLAIMRDSSHCMIAESIKAALPGVKRVSVDLATIRFTDTYVLKRYVFLTPRNAQLRILDFDQGIKPEPFIVRLGRPMQVVRAKGRNVNKTPVPTKSSIRDDKAFTAGRQAPIRDGGKTPPLGPHLGGDVSGRADAEARKTGKMRRFGVRPIPE